jgi:hypothetical protein
MMQHKKEGEFQRISWEAKVASKGNMLTVVQPLSRRLWLTSFLLYFSTIRIISSRRPC